MAGANGSTFAKTVFSCSISVLGLLAGSEGSMEDSSGVASGGCWGSCSMALLDTGQGFNQLHIGHTHISDLRCHAKVFCAQDQKCNGYKVKSRRDRKHLRGCPSPMFQKITDHLADLLDSSWGVVIIPRFAIPAVFKLAMILTTTP